MRICCIVLYTVFGKHGAFSKQKEKMWAVKLISVTGSEHGLPNDWPHPDKQYPLATANYWSSVLGWPIVEEDEVGNRANEPVRPWGKN